MQILRKIQNPSLRIQKKKRKETELPTWRRPNFEISMPTELVQKTFGSLTGLFLLTKLRISMTRLG